MTRGETGTIMDILAAAYPRYYAGISGQRRENALTMWATMFADDDIRLVVAATRSFIEADERGFPPVPGQIKAKIRLLTQQQEMTEMEAWGLVAKALKNSAYGSAEEFAKLPPVVRRVVGNPGQLREWGMMDSATVHSVVASNFQRSYKAIAAREREYNALPPAAREIVQQLLAAQNPMPELTEPAEKKGQHPEPQHEKTEQQDAKRRIAEIRRNQGNRAEKMGGDTGERKKYSREEIIRILRGETNQDG